VGLVFDQLYLLSHKVNARKIKKFVKKSLTFLKHRSYIDYENYEKPSRILHHDTALFFALLGTYEKVDTFFAKFRDCDYAIMTPSYFLSCLTLRKKFHEYAIVTHYFHLP